jgi:hypothetical protein
MELNEIVTQFVYDVRNHADSNAVSFKLYINSDGHVIEIDRRMENDLKPRGISMRNLHGKYISGAPDSGK